jgi:hypothetical protein
MKQDLVRMVPAVFPRPLLLVYFTGIPARVNNFDTHDPGIY